MKRYCLVVLCLFWLQVPSYLMAQDSPGVITTVAGSGPAELGKGDFSGDSGPATQARLNRPFSIAVGISGDIYIADLDNLRIRRIDSNAIITTFAGGGTAPPPSVPPPGSSLITLSDDGGPAVQAYLGRPFGVAADRKGNIYIAEEHQRVRRVDANGIITTFAGSGITGFSGDNGPAIYANFRGGSGVVVDPEGNVYIADASNHVVRRVSPDGIITTIVGIGPPTTFTGFVEGGFAGDGGPAIKARLKRPMGLAVGPDRSIYIADTNNHRIRRVGLDGIITTIAGTGTAGFAGDKGVAIQANLNNPQGIAVDIKGNVYIADTNNHRIRRVGLDGIITTIAGIGYYSFYGDGGMATKATLDWPSGVVVDAKGNIYIADQGFHRIRRVSGETLSTPPVQPPLINFVASVLSGETPLLVKFTAVSSGGPVTGYSWSFGDNENANSTETTIDHTYRSAGTYTVVLNVSGPGGSDTKTKEGFITVTAPKPVIVVLPASIGFGNVEVGQRGAPLKVTVSNIGNGVLEVSSVTLFGANPADFSVSSTIFNIVAGGLVRTIEVVFVPTSFGSKSALLHIYHNAAGSPSVITLDGVGVPPPPPVESNVGAFLAFPLSKRDPHNVRINSVFDHSMSRGSYTADGVVVAYTGEKGEVKYGQDYVTTINGNRLSGYQSSTTPNFKINGNYWGGGKQEFLYYDGHPGFDYRTRDDDQDPKNGQINVLAAADGVVTLFKDADSTLAINHGNDYITYYLHLSKRIVSDGASVKKGDIIGVSGKSSQTEIIPHLHFEVRLNKVPVDPYGWQGSGRDPYESRAKNVELWIKPIVVPPPPTPDFDGDGIVDLGDFFLFASAFGHKAVGEYAKFDLDGDGEIGLGDFFIFAASFGKRA